MTTFLHDDLLDPGAHWCPICGEPRGVCQCDESDFMQEAADDYDDWYQDDPRERVECKYCGGDGMLDDISPCPHCDGEGFEWWLL